MELKKLKDYIEFMKENNLVELEIEDEGKKIRLKKFSGDQSPAAATHQAAASFAPEKNAEAAQNEGVIEIKSPMVGTFYRSSSPGTKPYVDAGETIKPGDTVCIIEAMKLMNEIKAEKGGKIIKILVENGQPVEFGQKLFTMEQG